MSLVHVRFYWFDYLSTMLVPPYISRFIEFPAGCVDEMDVGAGVKIGM